MVLMTLLLRGANPRTLQELEEHPVVPVAKLGIEGWGRQSWEAAVPASPVLPCPPWWPCQLCAFCCGSTACLGGPASPAPSLVAAHAKAPRWH